MTLLVDWPVESPAPLRCAFVAAEASCALTLRAVLAREIAAREREALNGLYVAMTRAKAKLVISRTEPRPGFASPSAWWPLLAPHVEAWSPPSAVAPARGRAIVVPELPSWPAARPHAVRPSAVDDASVRLGSALHRVLEWARGPAGDTLPELVRGAAAHWSLDAAAARMLQRHAEAILSSPACRRFYDAAAYAWAGSEVPLASAVGEPWRADRIVRFDDGAGSSTWWLLDVKLHTAPQTRPEYVDQLRRYRDALCALLAPQDVVRCAFITGDGTVIEPELPR
jgi:ATP-dependent helicase/nuclease subunit A